MQKSALCRSRREVSNAYFLAKIGFDTAENEPPRTSPLKFAGPGPGVRYGYGDAYGYGDGYGSGTPGGGACRQGWIGQT